MLRPCATRASGEIVAVASGAGRPTVTVTPPGAVAATAVSTLWFHPHYLAYFNAVSGGPDRVPARLIDSNLDWGQDLVGLREWCRKNIPDQKIGLAYFGQINPNIFAAREDPLRWFTPPIQPEFYRSMSSGSAPVTGPVRRLTPGYYAVSATLLYGLHWRLYDHTPAWQRAWEPMWNVGSHAFGYFRRFQPIDRIGHSIYIYKLSEEDVARVEPFRHDDAIDRAIRLEQDLALREVEFERLAAVATALEDRIGIP